MYEPSRVVNTVSMTSPVSVLISSIPAPPIPGSPVTRMPLPSRSLKTVPDRIPLAMSPKLAVADPAAGTTTRVVLGVVLVNPSGSVSCKVYVPGMTPLNEKEPSTVVKVVSTTSPSSESSSTVTPPIPSSSVPRYSSPSRSSNTRPDMVPLAMSPKVAVAEPPEGTLTSMVLGVVLVNPSGSVSSTI